MVNIFLLFIIYIVIILVTAFILTVVFMGLLYCICWIIAFVNEFINNSWKDKND